MGFFGTFRPVARKYFMTKVNTPSPNDLLRQAANLLAAPLIWVCSSLGFFVDGARNPSAFSDLTENLLVPQPFAFSIWFPIFIGIMVYGVLQALRANRTRRVFRETGWWIAAGLWGIVGWGLITAFMPDAYVELFASLIFIPSMCALVVAMVKLSRLSQSLDRLEKIFVLAPISLIAGWCSIAVFVGLGGLAWSYAEVWGWSAVGTAVSVLSLTLWWVIYVLRQGAANKIYAFPIIWGLGFLALRHFGDNGSTWIGGLAVAGVIAVIVACTVKISEHSQSR